LTTSTNPLREQLSKAAGRTLRYAWVHYAMANVVAVIAVAGSVTATLLVALGSDQRLLTSVLAVVPTAVLAINSTFNFERKAIWHFRTSKRIEALLRRLEFENTSEEEVSRGFSQLDLETFDGWALYSALSRKDDQEPRGAHPAE